MRRRNTQWTFKYKQSFFLRGRLVNSINYTYSHLCVLTYQKKTSLQAVCVSSVHPSPYTLLHHVCGPTSCFVGAQIYILLLKVQTCHQVSNIFFKIFVKSQHQESSLVAGFMRKLYNAYSWWGGVPVQTEWKRLTSVFSLHEELKPDCFAHGPINKGRSVQEFNKLNCQLSLCSVNGDNKLNSAPAVGDSLSERSM